MEFTIYFGTSVGYFVNKGPINPGLKHLDEARVKFGPKINYFRPYGRYENIRVHLNEETARRMGNFFYNSGFRQVIVRGNTDKYSRIDYEKVDDQTVCAVWRVDEQRLIEDFIASGCPEEWHIENLG